MSGGDPRPERAQGRHRSLVPSPPSPALPRLLWLLSATACVTVANLYYSQPLLTVIGADLGVGPRTAGLVPTVSQIGYALGMLLFVPLGDALERRGLMAAMTAATAAALLAVALSPGLPWLLPASLVLGAVTIVPQLAVPFAATVVGDGVRGRAVGRVMSGLLIGILISRTVSGAVGARWGWRATYLGAAALMLVVALLLRLLLPRQEPPTRARWGELLASLPGLWRREPLLRRHALLGGLGFAAFSVLWTTLAFHLARPPLSRGSDVAGLFGVVGVAGALAAPLAGRLADRRGPSAVNLASLVVVLASFAVLWAGRASLVGLAAGVVVLDFGVQANHIANQTRVLGLSVALRSRVNTLYMVGYFVGGAVGSTVGAWAFAAGGFGRACAAGASFAGLALLAWASVGRREALALEVTAPYAPAAPTSR